MKKDDNEARIPVDAAAAADDEDIEFSFVVVRDLPESSVADASIETEDGRLFPLFDCSLLDDADAAAAAAEKEKDVTIDLQRLVLEEREVFPRHDSASSVDDPDAAAARGSCAWTPRSVPPSPERCKKSRSTGSSSSSLRLKLRDLMLGRSHSDGKEKFVLLAPTEKKSSETGKRAAVEKGKGRKATEVSLASLHRLYYDKAAAGGGARKSSLPYKQDLVGILGLGRTQHFN